MPRIPRRRLGAGVFHVWNRAHDKRFVFETDSDKRFFLSLLAERKRAKKMNAEKLWRSMYYRMLRSGRTFKQGEALFFLENHYWPPRNLPFMPKSTIDWALKVKDVPLEGLHSGEG